MKFKISTCTNQVMPGLAPARLSDLILFTLMAPDPLQSSAFCRGSRWPCPRLLLCPHPFIRSQLKHRVISRPCLVDPRLTLSAHTLLLQFVNLFLFVCLSHLASSYDKRQPCPLCSPLG